jgi:hypothetical protein
MVFVEAGVAYTWKTAYDESAMRRISPGTLLDDRGDASSISTIPTSSRTDSCAVPDHPVMSRLWSERRPTGHDGRSG